VTDFVSVPGAGVRGTVDGQDVVVGSAAFLAELGIAVPPALFRPAEAAQAEGQTAVFAAWDGLARGMLPVGDMIRPGSVEAVTRLRELGLSPVLVTGDSIGTARALSGRLGISPDRVFAGVRPEGKAQIIAEVQASGIAVAMVGDGVNDAAALARADLGMAVGTGTDAAIGAADLTLVGGDPATITAALQLAAATARVIRANLAWASGYNLIAIPLAALGYLNPLFAGIAMSASSLIVTANSLRLRRFRPARHPRDRDPAAPEQADAGPQARPALAEADQ
jgi:Cu+-exporting ATPase